MDTHLVAIDDLTRADIESLLSQAAQYQANGYTDALTGCVVASLFFEGSTRTRLSFETAVQRLGGSVIGFATADTTSYGKKGESLEDTIRMVAGYADAIVIRHPEAGTAARAAAVSSVPVINAGDGANEHPTQTLLDLFAIQQTQGQIDNLTVAMVGDLQYGRVPHSLARALALFQSTRQVWVAPDSLQMPDDVRAAVEAAGVAVTRTDDLAAAIPDADIVMMTRVQEERFEDNAEYQRVKDVYVLTPELLEGAKEHMRILHPLPRRFEIPESIDASPHAYYFEQAAGGVPVRAALLSALLG